jgi:VWFA-related protein
VSLGAALAAQQQQPVFRSGVQTVAVYATVLDQYGEMVFNLKQDDFKVFDNGKLQKLTTFAGGLQPITAILLLDTSASMTLSLDLAKNAAEQFVIRMQPGDHARVGSFSDRIDIAPEFTGDRDELLRAIREDLHIGNPTMLWDAIDEAMTELASLGGRRVILLFTDGLDTHSRTTAIKILDRAKADELMVYVVQFRAAPRGQLLEFPPTTGRQQVVDPRRTPPPSVALQQLSTQTGGGYFFLGPNDEVNATFTRVMQELHYQYVLGFAPQRADGKLHDIRVVVNRPATAVRARRNYLAPAARQ